MKKQCDICGKGYEHYSGYNGIGFVEMDESFELRTRAHLYLVCPECLAAIHRLVEERNKKE